MSDLEEIQAAIEKLPVEQVAELVRWLEARRASRPVPREVFDRWLERARGAAIPGVTTDSIMALTRGEE